MGFWSDLKADINTKVKQFNNSTFSDATMATCAYIASADGTVDASERKKVIGCIGGLEALNCFKAEDLGNKFNGYCDKAGNEFSKLDVLKAVGKAKSNPAQADTCLRVALIVANADGVFDDKEKVAVKELTQVLGLKYEDYVN